MQRIKTELETQNMQQQQKIIQLETKVAALLAEPKQKSQPEKQIDQIFVKNVMGKTITVDVDLKKDTFQQVKDRIYEKEGLEHSTYYLTFGGKTLQDQGTLACHKIRSQSTLHLHYKLA